MKYLAVVLAGVLLFSGVVMLYGKNSDAELGVEAFAQQLRIGKKADQEVVIDLHKDGTANVIHIVKGAKKAQHVRTIEGNVTDLSIRKEGGGSVQYANATAKEDYLAFTIFPSKQDVIIKYQLGQVMKFENGVWSWDYFYRSQSVFNFPDFVETIWVNNRPVKIGDESIRCHGCQMTLEYTEDEPVLTKKVTWQKKSFDVAIRTFAKTEQYEFSQPEKRFSFYTENGEGKMISVIMPKKLLWEPYNVFLNDNKTFNVEYYSNETHSWVGFKPKEAGQIDIVGTTVVPEFPMFMPLAVAMASILILGYYFAKKNNIIADITHR